MADTVQVMMEKMIPELEDLQARNILSRDEVRQVVERRRDFEYAMKRIPLRAIDALRYIEYELNLDALRLKRKERLGIQKPCPLSDNAGTRRVHSIFDRVLYKHRGNLDLWLQYIAFCKSEGSSRILSHVFSRALQVHPRSAEIWIEAAGYEFTHNLNVDSARVLLQRAIRITPNCARLWHEYFRLELLYIQKLTVRREILQLDNNAPAKKQSEEDDGTTVLIEPLPEEKQAADIEVVDEKQAAKMRARQQILDGAIARIIYTNAVAAIPKDVAFRLKFVEISDLFGRAFAANLSDFILSSCIEDFPQDERVHIVRALRPLAYSADDMETGEGEQLPTEKQVIANLEASVASMGTALMAERFADWLVERLASPEKTSALVAYAGGKLKELAFSHSPASANVAVRYVDFVHRTEGAKRALEVTKELCSSRFSASATLWLLQSQLAFHPNTSSSSTPSKRRRTSKKPSAVVESEETNPFAKTVSILREAVTKLDESDVAGQCAVHRRLIQLLVSNASSTSDEVQEVFQTALKSVTQGSRQWNELRCEFVAWAASALSTAEARSLYSKFLVDSQLLPTAETLAFLRLCVDVETSVVPGSRVAEKHVRALFERIVDLFGSSREDVWVDYISCLAGPALNRVADATRVHQRALRVWKDSSALSQLSLTGM